MQALARFRPVLGGLRNRLLPTEDCEVEVLCDRETQQVIPPSYLPDAIDRITKTVPLDTLENARREMTNTSLSHAPTLRYVTKNALVSVDGLATSRRIHLGGRDFVRQTRVGQIIELPQVRYVNTPVAMIYFGHWLHDSCRTAEIDTDTPLIMPHQNNWGHCEEYQDLLNLNPLDDHIYSAGTAVYYQDFGLGSYARARFRRMRAKLRSATMAGTGHERVFLRRGVSGSLRTFRNEEQLLARLSKDGWKIVDFTKLSAIELLRELRDASVVASMEGSHLAHALCAVETGSALVILMPHDRATMIFLRMGRASSLKVGYCVLSGAQTDGYDLDMDEFDRIVDATRNQPTPEL